MLINKILIVEILFQRAIKFNKTLPLVIPIRTQMHNKETNSKITRYFRIIKAKILFLVIIINRIKMLFLMKIKMPIQMLLTLMLMPTKEELVIIFLFRHSLKLKLAKQPQSNN